MVESIEVCKGCGSEAGTFRLHGGLFSDVRVARCGAGPFCPDCYVEHVACCATCADEERWEYGDLMYDEGRGT